MPDIHQLRDFAERQPMWAIVGLAIIVWFLWGVGNIIRAILGYGTAPGDDPR